MNTPARTIWVVASASLLICGCASKPVVGPSRVSADHVTPAASLGTNQTQTTRAPNVLPPALASAPVALAGEGWHAMFDGETLQGWQATPFVGRSEIEIKSGALLLNMGDPFNGLNWTNRFPKNNYEITLDAMRIMGSDFFCGLTVPIGTNFCSLIVGGWGGSLVGISSLDGMDASENETTKFANFERGRWYRIRMRVTTDRIEAWIDEDKLVDVTTREKKVNVRPGDIELSEPLGISCWQTTAAYRQLAWREVTGPADPPKKADY